MGFALAKPITDAPGAKDNLVMPTVLRIDGYRFFFYSLENNELPHIHIEQGDNAAKFWLNPVTLATNDGFRARELTNLYALASHH